MLLAARALTFLADVFPPACGSIIRHGAVPAFCARLLTIEYIDLAEQSLQVGTAVMERGEGGGRCVGKLWGWARWLVAPECKGAGRANPEGDGQAGLIDAALAGGG